VVRACRTGAAFPLSHLQVILLYNVVEAVVAHAVLIAELTPVPLPELATDYTVILLPDTIDELHAERILGQFAHITVSV